MKFDRSRSLWPTLAIAGAAALLSLYGVSARHAFAFEACAHCAATPGAIEVKDQTTRVEIREWPTPTRGTHPHDPLATPDGAIWYTGQKANLLGRLDPATGKVREFPLKEPEFRPAWPRRGQGRRQWFTAQAKGYIGKLDPASGEVREYIPKSAGRIDPHTPVFDKNGVLWFTAQAANVIGRLDPLTGEFALLSPPTKDSRALRHRIWRGRRALCRRIRREQESRALIRRRGASRSSCCRAKTRGRAASRRRATATSGTRILRAAGSGGSIPAMATSTIGFRPAARNRAPMRSPCSATTFGYVETGAEQNMLVRFDPKTRSFEQWPIPSGGGVVRNMVATPAGGLALACSGVDKIALATISPAAK